MKINKFLLLLLILVLPIRLLCSGEDFELWLNSAIGGDLSKKVKVEFEQEIRYENDASNFFRLGLEPNLLFRIKKGHYFGFSTKHIFEKDDPGKWLTENRLQFILINTFNLRPVKIKSRFKAVYKIPEEEDNNGAVREKLSIDLIDTKKFTLYVANEFYYNWNDFQRYDRKRIYLGVEVKLFKPFEIDVTYIRHDNKSRRLRPWSGKNILSITLATKF